MTTAKFVPIPTSLPILMMPSAPPETTHSTSSVHSTRRIAPHALRRNRLIGRVVGRILRVLSATLRVEWHGEEALLAAVARGRNGGIGAVVAFWHGDLGIPLMAMRDRAYVALVSRSADGEIINAALQYLGWKTRRGSQFWGGPQAVRALLKALREGETVVITPDGPRGPARIAAGGAEFVTARIGCELFPLGVAAQGKRFKTWDSFILPRPFGRVVIVVGAPVQSTAEAVQSTAEADSPLQCALEDCNAEARRLLAKS